MYRIGARDAIAGDSRMAQIGDFVTVKILGKSGTGTGITSGATSITISPGSSMSFQGKIVADEGDHWVVELNAPFGGTSTIKVSKEAEGAHG